MSGDSAGEKAVTVTAVGGESLTRAPTARGASFTLTLDAPDGTSRAGRPAERISGSLSGVQLTVESSSRIPSCDPARIQLRADLADLAFPVSAAIARGESWSDSVSNEACVSGITSLARTRRRFTAVGDTSFLGETAIIVQRKDSAVVSGEGALDGRALSLTADGFANARIYLSVPGGRVLRIEKDQLLRISVKSATRTKVFVQRLTSVIELRR